MYYLGIIEVINISVIYPMVNPKANQVAKQPDESATERHLMLIGAEAI